MAPDFHMTYCLAECSACGAEGEHLVVGEDLETGDVIADCGRCGAEFRAAPESII